MSTSIGQIPEITEVIDGIAFQTNILVLNAALEAVRSGIAGMSFAVVAGEMQNLARRSAQAASNIAGLIEDSILKSPGGSKNPDGIAISIRAITEGAATVNLLVDEIEASSKEQAQSSWPDFQVCCADKQVKQPMAASEEHVQSQTLMTLVDQLKALGGS